MMNTAQVMMNTGQGSNALSPQEAWWVAGFMIAGVLGLAVIGFLFRKHVEL